MAEKKIIDIETKESGLNNVVEKTKSLKAQLKEAIAEVQNMSAEFGETSQQVADAARKAAELKDRIEDANDAVLAFKGEGAFIATGKAVSSVASGFSAVEGAMGLLGVESDKLQETLLRVQSAMALAQGLEGLEDIGRSFKQLKVVAIDAFKGIKGAMLASGIGALVVTLGVIYSYWDDIKYAMSGVSAEQEALNAKSQANVEMQQKKLDSIGGQENILKLQGKSEKDILKLKIAQTDQVIQATEAQIKQNEITLKAQVAASKKNKEILKGILDFIAAPLILLLKGIDKVASAFGKNLKLAEGFKEVTANLIFDPQEVEQEGKKAIEEQKKALDELKNQQAGYKLAIKAINESASKDAQSKREEASKKELDELAELNKAQLEATKTQSELEILAITEKYDKLIALAKKYKQDTKALEEQKAQEIKAVNAKELEDLTGLTARKGQLTKEEMDASIKALTEKSALEQKARDDKKANDEKEAQERKDLIALQVSTVKGGFDLLGELATTFAGNSEKAQRKAFNIQKAASIASALIDTYTAAAGVFRDTKGGLPIRIAATAIATGAGLLRVAQIAKTQFNSSASSGGGGNTNPSLPQETQTAPNFNIVGNAAANAQLGQQPVQAYVVSGEVTSAQSLERNRIRTATL